MKAITTERKKLLLIGVAVFGSVLLVIFLATFIPDDLTWEDALGRIIIALFVVWKIIKWPLIIGLIGFRIYGLITKPKENLPYLIIGIVVGVVFYFFSGTNNWTGFYYPNAIVTTNNPVVQQGFKNKSACFDWINTMVKGNEKEDYECGTNCKYEASFDLRRCEDTYDSR